MQFHHINPRLVPPTTPTLPHTHTHTHLAPPQLVEISGLPFGLASDMLRYSGMTSYPFKGMLVGSANRWQPGSQAGLL